MKRIAAWLAAIAATATLAACTGETEPATDVTATSATLHGDVTWNDNEQSLDWRWTWSKDGGATWGGTAWQAVPPCANDPCSAHVTKTPINLVPDSHYIFRLVARDTQGNVYYGDSNGLGANDPPYEYDSFDTDPLPSDSYPSISPIERDGDFDPGCADGIAQAGAIGTGCWYERVSGNTAESSITAVTDRVAEGNTAGRFTVPAANDARAELNWFNKTSADPEVEYELLVWFPSGLPHVGYIAQNKFDGAGGSCHNGGLSISDQFSPAHVELVVIGNCVDGNETEIIRYDLGTFPRNQWFAIRVHEKFHDTAGFIQAWIEQDVIGNSGYVEAEPLRTGIDTTSDPGGGVKFRLGRYGDSSGTETIWLDGYRMECIVGTC